MEGWKSVRAVEEQVNQSGGIVNNELTNIGKLRGLGCFVGK